MHVVSLGFSQIIAIDQMVEHLHHYIQVRVIAEWAQWKR